MQKIIYYRTYSYGGMEGRDLEERNFETEELARLDAKLDHWNAGFSLYKVNLTIDKTIQESLELIEEGIKCGRYEDRLNPNNPLYGKENTKGRLELYQEYGRSVPEEITYYRTYSYGGVEGRDIEKRNFETEELARLDALNETWNYSFSLYKVILTLNGIITKKTQELERRIPCGRDEVNKVKKI